jgi:hypothetical protein
MVLLSSAVQVVTKLVEVWISSSWMGWMLGTDRDTLEAFSQRRMAGEEYACKSRTAWLESATRFEGSTVALARRKVSETHSSPLTPPSDMARAWNLTSAGGVENINALSTAVRGSERTWLERIENEEVSKRNMFAMQRTV